MQRLAGNRKSALVAVALAALAASIGLPHLLTFPPAGAVRGSVRATDGTALPGVSVALFDAACAELVATTRADERGNFVFSSAPPRFDLLALPEPGDGLVPHWRRSALLASGPHVSLVLAAARPLRVRVRDERGRPVEGAGVRGYETDEEPVRSAAVVAVARTDSDGVAVLSVPARTHVAVLPESAALAPVWVLDSSVPLGGANLEVALDDALTQNGRVTAGSGEPLSGVVVGSWSGRDESRWHGFALTGADGRFEIALGAREPRLHAWDPKGRALPARNSVEPSDGALEIALAGGREIEVRCADSQGVGRAASLRFYSDASEAWGWSVATDRSGRARAVVDRAFGASARPASRAFDRALLPQCTRGDAPLSITLPRAAQVATIPTRRGG